MDHGHNTGSAINARLVRRWLLGVLTVFAAAPVYSQSLGDIARQERERKQGQPPRTTHVYDNDDLSRPQILVPEDQERVREAKKKNAPPAGETAKETGGSIQKPDEPPTSDVAKREQASETNSQPRKPLRLSLQPMLVAPSLADPAPTRLPVRHATSPIPPDFGGARAEHVGKAVPRVEIMGNQKVAEAKGVRVQPGDTLWQLASKYLGHGQDWLVLAVHNPQVVDPQRLQVGTWITLPDEAQNPRSPDRIRVKQGDSLWKLTQARFGDGRAWSCVAQANPQLHDAHLIFPGQILEIPARCSPTSAATARFPEVSHRPPPVPSAELRRQAH